MLNVPEEIKELFHQDTCYKNIRIHFPNGERSDICNDLIVKDSVSFKESLCSQRTLKFGLCEASVFECETVGVGNIKNAEVNIYCEIGCDSSVEDAIWQVDLQKWVYQVPYGVFIISESKRQADMQHRKITAYNILSAYSFKLNKQQIFRAKSYNSSNSPFTQKLVPLITENMQSNSFQCAQTELSGFTSFNADYWTSPGINPFYFTHYYYGYRITSNTSNKLYRVVINNPININQIFVSYCSINYNLLPPSNYSRNGVDSKKGVKEFYVYPYMSMAASSDNNSWFKPSGTQDEGAYIAVCVGAYGTDFHGHSSTEKYVENSDIHIYELTVPINYTYSFERSKNSSGKYVVAEPESIDLKAIFNGFLETCGVFGFLNRFNVFETLNIKRQFELLPNTNVYPGTNVYPEGVVGGKLMPNDYQSCWYDDQYTLPYGAIDVEYKDTNNNNCEFIFYLSGYDGDSDPETYAVYSLTNNEIIRNTVWTQQEIEAICNVIANNISGVTYMPVDFKGRGLPYVEAGDTFEILTKSNDSITTIVLNRTITGEQTLVDTYQSV